jgi:hypothetical protein
MWLPILWAATSHEDFLRPQGRSYSRTRLFVHFHSVNSYRLSDVLDFSFAEILVAKRYLIFDLVVGRTRDANPALLCQTLHAGGDVDPIAVEPLSFDNHIPQVNADAELHLPLFWQLGVLHFKFVLNLHRATHGIDHTGELG